MYIAHITACIITKNVGNYEYHAAKMLAQKKKIKKNYSKFLRANTYNETSFEILSS